jgi:hypothetical protein
VVLVKPTPTREPPWFAMSRRICDRPIASSSGLDAFTKRPRAFTAACQRSSTASGPLLTHFGQRVLPDDRLASVALWPTESSVPRAPNEIAAKFRCCHDAGSTTLAGTLLVATVPVVLRSVTQ